MSEPMRFRKKPVVIEAMQYDPATAGACSALHEWAGVEHQAEKCSPSVSFFIETLEGRMEARPGDWVIRGVAGEYYPCKPDIFDQTYEPAPLSDDQETS